MEQVNNNSLYIGESKFCFDSAYDIKAVQDKFDSLITIARLMGYSVEVNAERFVNSYNLDIHIELDNKYCGFSFKTFYSRKEDEFLVQDIISYCYNVEERKYVRKILKEGDVLPFLSRGVDDFIEYI